MGHSSIKITVETYGHLIPGADIKWVDGLDRKATPQQNATPAQLLRDGSELTKEDHLQAIAALEDVGGRGSSRANELLTAC
ncbi:MAG TPA: hypothetical protein VN948_15720 [Terriglobales bacterium]|nr:hypothetical protein [Terriglobales bacterium]